MGILEIIGIMLIIMTMGFTVMIAAKFIIQAKGDELRKNAKEGDKIYGTILDRIFDKMFNELPDICIEKYKKFKSETEKE